MKLCNLYVKTEYSLLQSSCALDELIARAKQDNYSALAITDEGNMHGAIKFYEKCVSNNLKPIIGLKITYHYDNNENDLLLYAMNTFGYQNLMKIASRSKLNSGFVELEYLEKTTMGVLAIMPTDVKLIQSLLNNSSSSLSHLKLLQTYFDKFYFGMLNQTTEDIKQYEYIKDFSVNNQIKRVALAPICYLDNDDQDVYQVLIGIKNGKLSPLSEREEKMMYQSPRSLQTIFANDYEALANIEKIVNDCNVTIDFSHYHLPQYDENIEAYPYLQALCQKGLAKRLKDKISDANYTSEQKMRIEQHYRKRLDYELETINSMGFNDYFLIVWDCIKYAKKEGIYVGPGRGSAPASLVSYSLGITDIDPIEHKLLFERFLNKERISMPDIDIDLPDDERDTVIKYVGKRFGKEHVAHIVTFGTFAARSAIRDVARMLKLDEIRLKEILKHINKEPYVSLATIVSKSEALQELMINHDDIRKVIKISLKLEGLPRNTSTHAAGIIITKYDLVNYTPVDLGLNDIFQTQYEASDLEKLGVLKTDFLGLRNLTNIKKCVDSIKEEQPNFELPKEYNDQKTFEMLARGDTTGVFQLDSAGIRKVLRDLRVSSFEDVSSAIALYRPGPMEIIPTFIERKFGWEKVIYPHPDLETILKDTYGTIVYQDQIMLIAWKFAGYSLGQADILRRAVSKKKKDVLENERIHFVESSIKKGYTSETAELIYDYIVKFANYGFNKAHSISYAVVAYQTAYLKANYPEHYFCSLMSSVIGADNMLAGYVNETTRKGIKVLGPSINTSNISFLVNNHQILFPITAIQGIGMAKSAELIEERQKGKFRSFDDFVIRTKDIIPASLLENIIYAGALDEFGLTKKAMIDNYGSIINRGQYSFVANLVATTYDEEEFPYGILLSKEKEVLGLNLKYNFLYQYQHLYRNPKIVHIADVKDKVYVYVIGILKKVKEITTTKKELMAFCDITDDTSDLNVTVFPRLYMATPKLIIGQVYQIYGKIEMRKNQLQMVAEEIKLM